MKKSTLLKTLMLAALLVALVGGTASAGQAADPRFAAAVNYANPGPGTQMPTEIAKGDFDENGVLDLALAVSNSKNDLSLFKGNRDGTFDQPPRQFDVAQEVTSVLSSDLNDDGRLDLVLSALGATPGTTGSVVLLLGRGDGTFSKPLRSPSGGVFPSGLTDPDFDDDGDKDLAVVNGGSASSPPNVTILVNERNKAAKIGQIIPVGSGRGSAAVGIAKGDFDGDNDPDLLVTTPLSNQAGPLPGKVVVLENKNGRYERGGSVTVGSTPQRIVVGFFNGDGKLDFANTNVDSNNVSVRLGNGDGTFRSAGDIPSGGPEPTGITAADFNQDGMQDLAVTNVPGGTGSIGVLPGRGDGTFETPETFTAGVGPVGIVAGKFNRDGRPDLATANLFSNNLSVLINTTPR